MTWTKSIHKIVKQVGYLYEVTDRKTLYRRYELLIVDKPNLVQESSSDYLFPEPIDEEKYENKYNNEENFDPVLERREANNLRLVSQRLDQAPEVRDENLQLRRSNRQRRPANQLIDEDGFVINYGPESVSNARRRAGNGLKRSRLYFKPY
jgi:hypothetical protein